MMTTMYPYFLLTARWLIAALTMMVGVALAQAPQSIDCTGDDFVEGVNWDLTDNGSGMAYALGGGAVHISCDDGATWTKQPHPNASGYSMLIDPNDDAIVYVGSYSSGVYRSTDYGGSFSAASAGTIDEVVSALSAKADGTILAGTNSGIYESTDSGLSWSLLTTATAGAPIRSILVDPGNPNVIYAGTSGNGAYRTGDGGQSWESIGPFNYVNVLAFQPGNASGIVAAAWDGIWHSSDAGTSWVNVGGIRNSDFTFDPRNPSIAYRTSRLDGALKSFDGGQTWTPINNGLASVLNDMYAIHVLPSGTLIIGTEFDGVFRSNDAGASWILTGERDLESDSGSGSGNGSGSGSSGGSSGAVTPANNTASLRITVKYRGDKGSIKAGRTAKFRVTVTNNGPNVSTDTSVDFFWYRSGFFGSTGYSHTASPGQGHCSNTHDTQLFDCFLGDIPSGGSVVIEFKGQTGNGGTYYLLTLAYNAETSEAVESKTSISAKTELSCILIFCTTTSSGGGGATGWWMLVVLGAACGSGFSRDKSGLKALLRPC